MNPGNYTVGIGDNGTLEYSSSANQTFSGLINGTGNLLKDTSASVLTLSSVSSSNGYSGTTIVNAGTLSLTGTIGIGTGTAITSAATFTESSSGVIAGGSSLTVTAGTTSLAGANSYTRHYPGQRRHAEHNGFGCKYQQRHGFQWRNALWIRRQFLGTGLIGGAVAVNGGGTISLSARPAQSKQLTVNGLTLGTSGGTYGLGGGNATLTYAVGSGSPSAGVGNVEAIYVGTAGTSGGTLNVNSTAAYICPHRHQNLFLW